MPNHLKNQRVNELLSKHDTFQKKFENQQLPQIPSHPPESPDAWFQKVLDATPERFHRTTKSLLNHIKHSDSMNWDANGRLVLDGQAVEGTNVLDLVHSVTRPRKVIAPQGADIFLKALAGINTPSELVPNAKSLKIPTTPLRPHKTDIKKTFGLSVRSLKKRAKSADLSPRNRKRGTSDLGPYSTPVRTSKRKVGAYDGGPIKGWESL